MSIPELFEQVDRWGWCYLLTVSGGAVSGGAVSDRERPHLLALWPTVVGDGSDRQLRFVTGGGTAWRNARARPAVTLVFPPGGHSDGHSLVVDGEATADDTIDGAIVDVRPSGAVLHRPAP